MPGSEKWLVPIRRTADPRLTLLCFSYAGGSPELFRRWPEGIAADVDILALCLPGHGRRLKEELYRDWEPLTRDVLAAVSPLLGLPHALYGHSFGGRLAYEVALLARTAYPGRTVGLFVSGCRAPDQPQARPYLHELDEGGFGEALGGMGGTPAEFLADAALRKLLLPVIQAEIRLAELWDGDGRRGPIAAPVTALHGRDDRVDPLPAMRGWPGFGGAGSELLTLPGGHFFPETHREPLLAAINARLPWSPGSDAGNRPSRS